MRNNLLQHFFYWKFENEWRERKLQPRHYSTKLENIIQHRSQMKSCLSVCWTALVLVIIWTSQPPSKDVSLVHLSSAVHLCMLEKLQWSHLDIHRNSPRRYIRSADPTTKLDPYVPNITLYHFPSQCRPMFINQTLRIISYDSITSRWIKMNKERTQILNRHLVRPIFSCHKEVTEETIDWFFHHS